MKIHAQPINPLVIFLFIFPFVTAWIPISDFIAAREVRWQIFVPGAFLPIMAMIFFSGLSVELSKGNLVVTKLHLFKEFARLDDVVGWRRTSGPPIGGGLPVPRIEVFIKDKKIPIMIPIKPLKAEDTKLLMAEMLEAYGEQLKKAPRVDKASKE